MLDFMLARPEKDVVVLELGSAAACLLLLAEQCNVDLGLSVDLKIKLNTKKYPAVLVRYKDEPEMFHVHIRRRWMIKYCSMHIRWYIWHRRSEVLHVHALVARGTCNALTDEKHSHSIRRGSALKYDAYKTTTGFAKGSKQVRIFEHVGLWMLSTDSLVCFLERGVADCYRLCNVSLFVLQLVRALGAVCR